MRGRERAGRESWDEQGQDPTADQAGPTEAYATGEGAAEDPTRPYPAGWDRGPEQVDPQGHREHPDYAERQAAAEQQGRVGQDEAGWQDPQGDDQQAYDQQWHGQQGVGPQYTDPGYADPQYAEPQYADPGYAGYQPQDAPLPEEPQRVKARGGILRALVALLASAACVVGIVYLARLAVGTPAGQRLDQLILTGAQGDTGQVTEWAELAVTTVSVPVVAGVLALAAVMVLLRGKPGLLIPLVVLVAGANITTQVVKHLVVDREALTSGVEVTPNSFPSGHTALAAAAAVALVLASGHLRWLLAPLGAVWTAAAGVGTVVVGWHRPSDVVGSILIVAAWTFLVLAVDNIHSRIRRGRGEVPSGWGRRRRGIPMTGEAPRTSLIDGGMATLLIITGLAALALTAVTGSTLSLPLDLESSEQQRAAYLATSALIAGGTAIWFALVLVLRGPQVRRMPAPRRVP